MTPRKNLAVLECCPKPLWGKEKRLSACGIGRSAGNNARPETTSEVRIVRASLRMEQPAATLAALRMWLTCVVSFDKWLPLGTQPRCENRTPSAAWSSSSPAGGDFSACANLPQVDAARLQDLQAGTRPSGRPEGVTTAAVRVRQGPATLLDGSRSTRTSGGTQKETGPRRAPRAWDSLLASDRLDHQFGCSSSAGWSSPSIERR